MSASGWISTTEAAHILRVDRKTVLNMIGSGRLDGVRAGHHWRVREADVRALSAREATRA